MSWQIKVEDLSKLYRLGEVGTGTLSQDLNRWWHSVRGKEDPYSKVGQVNDRSSSAESDFVWALKDINFEVECGEVLGIIGRNGAGKSTLLKILSKITSPSEGVIKTKGRIASLLEVGTGMHPEMSARDNIYLNGAILGMTKKEITDKFDEIVEFSGCEMYIDTPLKRYSSGMRVRLGFAVAAFLEPEILIVDEVLAVGDAEFQSKAIGKMKEISKGGKRTVLFVSHNMAAIKSLCTRALLMENGTISAEGTPVEMVEKYMQFNNKLKVTSVKEPEVDLNSHRKRNEIFMQSAKLSVDHPSIGEEFYIDFEFDLLDGNQGELTVAMDLLSLEDNIIFGSAFKLENVVKGRQSCRCFFPKDLMNDISVYINFYVLDKKLKAVYAGNRILSFDFKEEIRDELFFEKINGYLRPKIKWEKIS
jgi:lipopolysaccharide transport system ATP-binding protein